MNVYEYMKFSFFNYWASFEKTKFSCDIIFFTVKC